MLTKKYILLLLLGSAILFSAEEQKQYFISSSPIANECISPRKPYVIAIRPNPAQLQTIMYLMNEASENSSSNPHFWLKNIVVLNNENKIINTAILNASSMRDLFNYIYHAPWTTLPE